MSIPAWATVAAVAAVAVAAWCAGDVRRRVTDRRARRGWWWALGAAVVLAPFTGFLTVPVREARVYYDGPDLLSGAPPATGVAAQSWAVPGLVRERTLRTTQDGRLLQETTRLELGVPVLLLLVVLAWLTVRRRRGLRLGVVTLVLAGGAWGCGGQGGEGPTLAETRLLELMAMRGSGDVAGAERLFHPVAVYDDYPNQVQYRGLPEIAEYIQGLHRWASGVFLDVTRVHPGVGRAAAEWVLEGVQSAPYPGVADSATYRRFRLEGVTLIELEGGLIVRAADYADLVPLILDLGGSVTLPSGEVVTLPETDPGPG